MAYLQQDQLRQLSLLINQLYLDPLAREYLRLNAVDIRNAYGYQPTLSTFVRAGFDCWISKEARTVCELRDMLRSGCERGISLLRPLEALPTKDKDQDVLTPDILDQVCKRFTKNQWDLFYQIYLNIQEDEIDNAVPLISSNVHDAIFTVLQLWVTKNSEDATASNLLEIFEKARKQGYVDQSAIDYLNSIVLEKDVASYGVEEGKRYGQDYNGRYEIKSDVPFGKAIIICNHEFDDTSHNRTPGSEEDVKLLRTLARRMSFTNREFLNLGKQELLGQLRVESQKKYDQVSMLMIVIMSHGNTGGFRTKDWHLVPVPTILNMFNQSTCPGLKDKPKLVIVQACRKELVLPGPNADVTDSKPVAVVKPTELCAPKATSTINAESGMGDSLDTVPIPSTSSADDLLHFHVENATVDGFAAYRSDNGSRFMQLVVNEIYKANGEQHVVDIFTKVRDHMDQINNASNAFRVQLSSGGPSNLKKHLYLPKPNPQ